MRVWALQVALAACLLVPSSGHFFESGFSHHYTYKADNSLHDQHNVTTILKFQIRAVNETDDGHRVHSLSVDSLVQFVKDGVLMNNPLQWDLSKTFLFVTDQAGIVRLVHCHSQDHDELILIKKAMTSIFSVTVKIEEDKDSWNYTTHETDHLGDLHHTYTAHKSTSGLKLHRKHASANEAIREHEKVLHYDNKGTLHTAVATDKLWVKDRSTPTKPRSPMPGEKPHIITTSGDFPVISSSATVSVSLDQKRRMTEKHGTFHNLTAQTLIHTPKPARKHKLSEVNKNITSVFQCLRLHHEKNSEKRSQCINNLRRILINLETEDLKSFANNLLGNGCPSKDTLCEDRKLVVIDILARAGDVTSQDMLITHVLSKTPAVDEELRRVFLHCAGLEHPTQSFIQAVAKYCFGEQGEHHGSRDMTRTQSRACLSVGSMARHLHTGGRHDVATRLVDRLESWLQRHAEGDPHISKRDTWLEETEHERHHVSKAVLLHALGNAAMSRSRRHLMEHARPNRGHQVWRRAALEAMRRYNCTQTAQVMLDSLLNDDKHSVRRQALAVFVKHPLRHHVTRQHENHVLSREYTYQTVARVKRDILEKVLLRFKIELPKVDWKKELGNRAVGASFGVYAENSIDALFRVLNGYVDVNVHDKVWAEIHLGIINRHWDLLLAEVCYKGRLSYNMNIVKDYTVGLFKDISGAFDDVVHRILQPLENAANDLAGRYQDAASSQPKSGFESLSVAVKELPKQTERALQATQDLSQMADSLGDLPLVTRLQQLSSRAQSIMEDIHNEATDLFANIKDSAVVALPFAEQEIRHSLNTVLNKLGAVTEAPRQTFSFIERAKMGFTLAMQRVLEGHNILKQATGFLSGSRSSFLNSAHELDDIVTTAHVLLTRLSDQRSRNRRDTDPFDLDEFGDSVGDQLDQALDDLASKTQLMADTLTNATRGARALQQGLDREALYVEVLKASYQAFREAIDKIKSRINALFGQKFHPKFPQQRRDCDHHCGCGYFPTDRARYGHPGVELKLDPGWMIVSPVAGVARLEGNHSITIQPYTSGFTDYVITLSNLALVVPINSSGTFIDAGQPLGTPLGKNGCEDSHFHLSMKRAPSEMGATGLCYYVDPSPFLDHMQPIPQWHQECKDFQFKHIGDVIDFSHLSDGFSVILKELERVALEVGKQLVLKVVDQLPDTGFLGTMKGITSDIVSSLDLDMDPANLKNLVKGAVKSNMKDFFVNIATKHFSVDRLMVMASRLASNNVLNRSLNRVASLVSKAQSLIQNPPLGILKSLPAGAIGRLLTSRKVAGILPAGLGAAVSRFGAGLAGGSNHDDDSNPHALPSNGEGCESSDLGSLVDSGVHRAQDFLVNEAAELGSSLGPDQSLLFAGVTSQVTTYVTGRTNMVAALKTSVCRMCASLGNALSRLTHSACMAHQDCLGLNCDVTINKGPLRGRVQFSMTVDIHNQVVTLTADGQRQHVKNDSNTGTVPTRLKVFRTFGVGFKVGARWEEGVVHFTLGVVACVGSFCLPPVPVIKDLRFGPHRTKRSAEELLGPYVSSMQSMAVDDVSKMFSDFGLPMTDLTEQITGIQEQISSSLSPNEDQADQTVDTEFPDPIDHQDKGQFPLQGQNSEVYIPFFHFVFIFQIGPLRFTMKFEAGGSIGLSFDVKVQALDSLLTTELKPWVAGEFHATFSASIVIASCGIDLDGWVLKTGFPLSLIATYTKQPVVTTKKLEVELIPIELKLTGWVKIFFVINTHKTIWHYTAPAFRGTLWEHSDSKDDSGPPRFPTCQIDGPMATTTAATTIRTTVSPPPCCTVQQIPGRHHKDPAFLLQFTAEDEDSDLKLWYAVGTFKDATDVRGWTAMRGSTILVPDDSLPSGIRLCFAVKARNSQGLESTCSCPCLGTYDSTLPEGRVDAAYRCSSHPSRLAARVILFDDSPLKEDRLRQAVGLGPGSQGHQVVDWRPLSLSRSEQHSAQSGPLRQFSSPRPGRLSTSPSSTLQASSPEDCASACLRHPPCISFSFHPYLHHCELQTVTESSKALRLPAEYYATYERTGQSLTAFLRYENLQLRHGTRYYVNADVENVLGYRTVLTSDGTMVDMTPPEPGEVGEVVMDSVTSEGCNVSILQRCEDHVKGSLNHRKIIDGKGSNSVLNGNRRGQELQFTMENYHIAANWQGFRDEECGIHGYTWWAGREVCGSDVVSPRDPHSAIPNPADWTRVGVARDLQLSDGQYYVTVQAVSDIIHGGDLVTTVCHSAPLIIDTTPPLFQAVSDFLFDDSFRFLVVYYDVSDTISGVARIELGLGRTKYDVMLRPYAPFTMRGVEGNTYIVYEDFETEDGVPAWIRIKVVNGVGMSSTGSSSAPILLDNTPPYAGHVMDGDKLGQDICCQTSSTEICVQWADFSDPDSNIDSFDWGVGLSPGSDDVLPYHTLSSYDRQACEHVTLAHNTTYFSTIIATNKALNAKVTNTTSDGLLIDVTPPVAGVVSDGDDVTNDLNYTSETASVTASWKDFSDPESGLDSYTMSVIVNGEVEKTFTDISDTWDSYTDSSLSLHHGDSLVVELEAKNRAGGTVKVQTDGLTVDHTPPIALQVTTATGALFQLRDDLLDFLWDFHDPESGIEEYRAVVFQNYQGAKTKLWPETDDYHSIPLTLTASTLTSFPLQGLNLLNGASYSVKVTAVNRAKMATASESMSVTVDTTPPDILRVRLARAGEEEDVNDDGEVEVVDGEPIWVSWLPHDTESGILNTHLCLGPVGDDSCLASQDLHIVDGTLPPSFAIKHQNLTLSSDEQKTLYQAYVVVRNGAGLDSVLQTSKPFLVLKANVPGVVLDGREAEDNDFSQDKASIAVTFSGFSSEKCGIEGYEWAVGTAPFSTDVLPYTDFGLVVDEESGRGFAQMHLMVFEGQKYYSSVRARTGHNCHEQYIVSSSNGFTVDTSPPDVTFHVGSRAVTSEEVVYQSSEDHLEVLWHVKDSSGINQTRLVLDTFNPHASLKLVEASPADPLVLTTRPSSGDSFFPELIITDNAGNERVASLPAVTFDMTSPEFRDFNCTPVVSFSSSVVACKWDSVRETDSALTLIHMGLGSGPAEANLLTDSPIHVHARQWSFDVKDIITSSKPTEFYVIAHAGNAAGLVADVRVKVLVDSSPPDVGDVRIVTSPKPGFHDALQTCQTSDDVIEVYLADVSDAQSGIERVELALGSSRGRSDIQAFRQHRSLDNLYLLGHLALPHGATVYVTARVINQVGLYTIATSRGVVISPEPRLLVLDGGQEVDVDGQTDTHTLQGTWLYSHPCPVVSAEWSIQELSGKAVTNFTRIPDAGRQFQNDSLALENFKTYVNVVRIRDALNRTRIAFSDGVTVLVRQPDIAVVRDGPDDNDLDFQEATDTLSANWDHFGDPQSTLPSDQIIRYEAAVGTDTGFLSSRSDVHAFEDVGLDTNVTFFGLNLTAKSQTYFITVRAYSAAGSYAETSSDGIAVGYSGLVTPGRVQVALFQSSVNSAWFSWLGFESDMTITRYYAGLSSTPPSLDNGTRAWEQLKEQSGGTFDVFSLHALQSSSVAEVGDLKLKHGDVFYVTVVAVDTMGHYSAAVSQPVMVDTTPPLPGVITVEGEDTETVIFVHSPRFITVNLDGLTDPESGVESVKVHLFSASSCDLDHDLDLVTSLDANNQSSITIRDLNLQEDTVYVLRVTVHNRAGLETKTTSRPVLLDITPPVAGEVRLGSSWTSPDQTYRHDTHTVDATIALAGPDQQDCTTQLDLLAPGTRTDWSAKQDGFGADCVGFDDSHLVVSLMHNAHFDGVDRGAAQYPPMAWREGDYKVRMTPVVKQHFMTGWALTSPALQPPFLHQNGMGSENTSLPCDSSLGLCLEDRNETTRQGAMRREAEYGTGLTFLEVAGQVKLLFWAQDATHFTHSWVPLSVNPVTTPPQLVLSLKKRADSVTDMYEVTVSVNGQPMTSVSGMLFPDQFVLSVYSLNIDDYVPPLVDMFHPFRAETRVWSVSVPVAHRPLCSYGAAFTDTVSGVREVWVGVSDNDNDTANVAPFTLQRSFCMPCLLRCPQLCASCSGHVLPADFTVFPLQLTGLALEAADKVLEDAKMMMMNQTSSNDTAFNSTSQELHNYHLPTYYLTVRVVDHSGLHTDVTSRGLVLDTSPPLIKSLRCFDPDYFKDVEIHYLGNTHALGVTWDVSEDVSAILGGRLALGTQPGVGDVVDITFNKTATEHVFNGLSLSDDTTYYVTIYVINEAGLRGEAWTNVTVHTSPPDLGALSLRPSNVSSRRVGNVEVGLVTSSQHLELSLDLDPRLAASMDVEYYELSISTADDKDDVFPRTVVGEKHAKKVAIVDGFVQRDETSANISVGDYTKKNLSTEDLPDPSASLFVMEPGRCLTQKLYGVSKAHVSTSFDVMPICVKRQNDVMLEAGGTGHVMRHHGAMLSVDSTTSVNQDELTVKVKLNKGGLLAGTLTPADLSKVYGSSASAEFSPFVVQPDTSDDTASRWLRKKLVSTPGPSLFLSPVAEAEFANDLEVSYTVPSTVNVASGNVVSLLLWNAGDKVWQSPEEVCGRGSQTYDDVSCHISAKLCPELFQVHPSTQPTNHRRKRSSGSTNSTTITIPTLGPKMVTVAVVRTSLPNASPTMHSTAFTLLEDHGMVHFRLSYSDPEGDTVTFTLLGSPAHGRANVTSDGLLSYTPAANFVGRDVIHIKGTEVISPATQSLGVTPNDVIFDVTVNVSNVNDPPNIFYLPVTNDTTVHQELMVGPASGNGVNLTVLIEGNSSTHITLGLVVFSDPDPHDNLTLHSLPGVARGARFEESEVDSQDPRLADFKTSGVTTQATAVDLHLPSDFSGHVSYRARVKDAAGSLSLLLSVNVFVLLSPCIHGDCRPRDSRSTCWRVERAVSFGRFQCHCDLGYEGEWCQTETNECDTATCSPITDCVDLIGQYRCDVNAVKMAAIILCSLVALVLLAYAVYRLKKRSSKVSSWPAADCEDDLKKPSSVLTTDCDPSDGDTDLSDPPPTELAECSPAWLTREASVLTTAEVLPSLTPRLSSPDTPDSTVSAETSPYTLPLPPVPDTSTTSRTPPAFPGPSAKDLDLSLAIYNSPYSQPVPRPARLQGLPLKQLGSKGKPLQSVGGKGKSPLKGQGQAKVSAPSGGRVVTTGRGEKEKLTRIEM